MNRPRPYYWIIAILCFVSLIAIFLPYLTLPEDQVNEEGYLINMQQAALDSDIIQQVAEETGRTEREIYRIGQTIVRGRDPKEEDVQIYQRLSTLFDERIEQLREIDSIRQTRFSFWGIISVSLAVLRFFGQNGISAVLVILCLILNMVLPIVMGILLLQRKGEKVYKTVQVLSLINTGLALLGLISINAISIGALQVSPFLRSYWGIANWIVICLNLLIWLLAVAATIHERNAGFVTWKIIARQKQLIFMTIPFIIYALVFYYAPLAGWVTAFQNFKPSLSSDQQAWVAWDKFKYLFSNNEFMNVIRNTIVMSVINLVLTTFFSIGFALLLNEVRNLHGKKLVQTVSYLPHFLSWIIVTGIVNDVLSTETGIINQLLVNLNISDRPINFFADPKYFWWIVGLSNVWKSTGWGSIIYLSAITAISPDLYEAASIDGAGRLKKMRHITLPSIRPTILILLIINIGNILNAGFEVQYLLGNGLVQSVSQTIDIYVLRYGISLFDFSLGTAAGIFKSIVSVVLIYLANRFARAAGEERLF